MQPQKRKRAPLGPAPFCLLLSAASILRRVKPLGMASSSLHLPKSLPTPFSAAASFRTLSLPLLSLPKPRAFSPNSIALTFRSRTFLAAAMASTTTDKKVFDSEEDLAVSLANYTADLSHKFSKERGCFTIVLSGGSLVKSLRKLVAPPYIDSVEWSKWHVFWVDERVVPKDHDDSNYKLAYDGFLSKVPILPGNVYAINDALSAEGAAGDYETCLKHLVKNGVIDTSVHSGFPKFDLMLLGMGPDGHVASLFPGHPLLEEDKKWVTFIKDSPKPPPERITFTFPVINSSAYIAMVVAGAGKAGVVKQALENNKNLETLPVQRVSPEGELAWFLDKDAASKL